MNTEFAIAIYRPHRGKERKVEELLKMHIPLLQREGLVTDKTAYILRSPIDGTFLEIFEWISTEAAQKAHSHSEISLLWSEMSEIADFGTLSDLKEAGESFPRFHLFTSFEE